MLRRLRCPVFWEGTPAKGCRRPTQKLYHWIIPWNYITPPSFHAPHPLLYNALTPTFATVNFLNLAVTLRRILIEQNTAFVHINRYKIQGYRKWYYFKIQTYLPPFSPPSTSPKNTQTTLNPPLLNFSLARHWVANKVTAEEAIEVKIKSLKLMHIISVNKYWVFRVSLSLATDPFYKR